MAAMKTFQREANILATLAHPAIPKIYDFFDQNSRAYLVMEYINGNDLEALLNKVKTLPINKIWNGRLSCVMCCITCTAISLNPLSSVI